MFKIRVFPAVKNNLLPHHFFVCMHIEPYSHRKQFFFRAKSEHRTAAVFAGSMCYALKPLAALSAAYKCLCGQKAAFITKNNVFRKDVVITTTA